VAAACLALATAAGSRGQTPPAPDALPLASPATAQDRLPALPAGAAGEPGAAETVTLDRTEFEKLFNDAMDRRDEEIKKAKDVEKKRKDAEGAVVGSDLNMTASWRNGVWFQSPNKDFVLHLGGSLQYDFTWFTAGYQVQFGPGGVGEVSDGVTPRRGRLRADGTISEVLDFIFEIEFFNGFATTTNNPQPSQVFETPGPVDAYLNFKNLPVVGNIRIGSQKEPFSLEHLNSDRSLEFLERSFLFDAAATSAVNGGRAPGIMAFNSQFDDRWTWAVGVFKNHTDQFGFGVGDGTYAVTGRTTFLPLYEDDGNELIHFGGAASHRDLVNGQVQLRARDVIRNAPQPLQITLANTGQISGTSEDLYNAEFAAVWGPLTIEAEYLAAFVHDASTPATGQVSTAFFTGCYVEALYLLTGEHRDWNKKSAVFGRVTPFEPFYLVDGCHGWGHGWGAWEIGARYSYIDLTNRGIFGGVLHDLTLGLSWYLTFNAKIQLNYDIVARSDTGTNSDGVIQGLGLRLAYDF
jgi:phosphate-selective porin OprO/OprP